MSVCAENADSNELQNPLFNIFHSVMVLSKNLGKKNNRVLLYFLGDIKDDTLVTLAFASDLD